MKSEKQPDGTYRMVCNPLKQSLNAFHMPRTVVPKIQWTAETGMSRYEWEREVTATHQLEFYEALRQRMLKDPPNPLNPEIMKIMADGMVDLPDGMKGYTPEVMALLDKGNFEHHFVTPDEHWRFTLLADQWAGGPPGGVMRKVLVSHRDYRTVADWNMIIRVRSWAFEDLADAFIYMPGQDTSIRGWEARYENGRPNCIQIVSPFMAEEETA